jgi:hypothetical protein
MSTTFLELQLSADGLATLFGVRANPASLITKNPLTVGTDQYLVQNAQAKSNAVLQYVNPTMFTINYINALSSFAPGTVQVPGKQVQVSQVVTVSLLKLVKDSAGNVTGMVDGGSYDSQVNALISVTNNTATSAVQISFSVANVVPLYPQTDFIPAMKTLLQGYLSSTSIPIKAPSELGVGAASNAGIAVGVDSMSNPFLAIRIEYTPDLVEFAAQLNWSLFYAGVIPQHLNFGGLSEVWSAFIPGDWVANLTSAQTEAGLALHTDKMVLVGSVSSVWAPDADGTARVNSAFTADVFHACAGISDLDYNITTTSTITLDPSLTNTLLTSGHADWTPTHRLAADLCEVLVAFAVGLLFSTPLTPAIGFGLGSVLGLIGAIIGYNNYQPTLSLPPNCTQGSGGHDYSCTSTITFPVGTGSLTLNEIFGASDGLIMSGPATGLFAFHLIKVNLSSGSFRWLPPVLPCIDVGPNTMVKVTASIASTAVAACDITLTVVGQGQLQIWDASLITSDPAGVVSAGAITVTNFGPSSVVQIAIHPNAAYAANPYNIGLFITSNAGGFFVNTGTIPALNQQAKDWMIGQLQNQLGGCTITADPWWQEFHSFNLSWLIDPPEGGTTVDQVSIVQVEGLGALEAVQLADEAGNILAAARANSQGLAVISYLASGADLARVPALSRVNVGASVATSFFAAGGPSTAETALIKAQPVRPRHVAITYAEMIQRATLHSDAPYRQVAAAVVSGSPVLVALSGERIDVFDVSYPPRPFYLSGTISPMASGLCAIGSGLLAWGKNGLTWHETPTAPGRSIDNDPVIGAVTYANYVAVLRSDRLDVLSRAKLTVVEQHAALGALSVATTSRAVLVVTANSIDAYSAVGPCGLARVGCYPSTGVQMLNGSPDIYPRTAIITSGRCGGSWLTDFANPQTPLRIGYFAQRPWISDATQVGAVNVRIASDRTSLVVSTPGRTLRTYREPRS